ncbi:hypothetical protein Taro_049058 [Colocasia esculenta]|uniref:Uncharacterized protein n=1 Tax=Colocasia esculenta TaxID=4460 RepID=A0A843X9R6_COLES|nr:hypothetical protein [Colocasia esculenta]
MSEGVQEDDTDLDGTTLYWDKPRAQQTHVPGSQRTWGTRLERHSGIEESTKDSKGLRLGSDVNLIVTIPRTNHNN